MTASPTESPPLEATFDALPLGSDVRRAIDAMGYRVPTPVQKAVFEPAAEGRDLVVQARTGTGKTAAFALPIVDRIVRASSKSVQAMVLCPTRELALQVAREVTQIGQFRGTQVVAIYGGAPMTRQIAALQAGAQIVVGTPGRVLDHLRQKTLDPSGIRVLVLDEADEMLSMGFAKELHAILDTLPKNRQGLFFSATLPPDIERLAQTRLRNPELITLSSDQVGALEVAHYVYVLPGGDKIGQLVRILEVEDPESAIIFCNTRDETQRVAEGLKARGFDADWLNGDLPQTDRERVMSATKEGRLRFLVATDVAARGIDISHLTHVVNYDFPETAEQYVHRTGRTGRAGRTGTAIALVGPKDIGNVYLLRLTYKIRPIEKQLPTAGELKTRAELDVVQVFVDAFASRPVHPDDLALARRLLTHDDAERIVAGLLRDHLGAREGAGATAATEAAEARRARNPRPRLEAAAPAPPPAAAQPAHAAPVNAARVPAPSIATASVAAASRPAASVAVASVAAASGPAAPGPAASGPAASGPAASGPPSAAAARRPPPDRASRSAGRPEPRARRAPTAWSPPAEDDDEHPILAAGSRRAPAIDPESRLPGITISDAPAPSSRSSRSPGPADPGERDPRERADDLDPDFVDLFVNVGKREGVGPGDLQRLLLERGLSVEDTGKIRVRDRMSYVRVRKDVFERAVAALAGQVIGGRTVVAELARR